MSGFTALNVEPEDAFEEEVDDTKEIQLEEAFKLYQNALKLHSQGPDFFAEALDAYRELLRSEVFKYPEVVSEYAHDQEDEEAAISAVQPEATSLSLLPSNAAESSANSVPQLVYLSFKNRGQFVIDVARHQLSHDVTSRGELCRYYAKSCKECLKDFAEALERDDSDLDLWKKAARVADVLSTHRIARFCLESVLAGDDDGSEQTIDLSGLDEAYAAGELGEVIKLLQDDLSLNRTADVKPKERLLKILKMTSDPYRYLPKRSATIDYTDDKKKPASFRVEHEVFSPTSSSLASIGQLLLQAVVRYQDGDAVIGTNTIVSIQLPDGPAASPDAVMTDSPEAQDVGGNSFDRSKDAPDVPTTDLRRPDPEKDSHDDRSKPSSGDEGGMEKVTGGQGLGHTDFSGDVDAVIADLPTRKRSSTVAGHDEPEGRTKSKRLRARESMADLPAQDEETSHELPKFSLEQLASYAYADMCLLATVDDTMVTVGLPLIGTLEDIRAEFWHDSNTINGAASTTTTSQSSSPLADLRDALGTWSDEKSQAIINGHGNQDFVEKSTGLTLFLQHSKPSATKETDTSSGSDHGPFSSFANSVNSAPTNLIDASIQWLTALLAPSQIRNTSLRSSYLRERWPSELKQSVVQLIMRIEEQLHNHLRLQLQRLSTNRNLSGSDLALRQTTELAQTIFELHLDVDYLINNPSSKVDKDTRTTQSLSLRRWALLCDDYVQTYCNFQEELDIKDELLLRFIWSSTIYANQADGTEKSHVILCLQDLRKVVEHAGSPDIVLPNNAAIPQISVPALDQEMSRLSTLDFFLAVFDTDNSDPVAVVEQLEPILEFNAEGEVDGSLDHSETEQRQQIRDLVKFLQSGDASLKLFLWRRLQNAYTAISYTPKIVSCLLRAMGTIVEELRSARHCGSENSRRQISMLKWLRDIDELVIKTLVKVQTEDNALDCMDEAHLAESLEVVTWLCQLLHGFALYDDSMRIGQIAPPQLKGVSSVRLFEKSKDRFREMIVRLWTLFYVLLKEATVQFAKAFETPAETLANVLSYTHQVLGLRHYCRYSNKVYVKLVKSELTSLEPTSDFSLELAQAYFDLYQLRLAPGFGDADHGCPPEAVDKKTAAALIPTVMKYASRLNMRDLIKSDLKNAIDKVQSASGAVKNSPSLNFNRKLISAYLKGPILPSELYSCIKGIGDLPIRPVHNETKAAASNGWYFLIGHMTLAKYKSVKRVNPTPTDDLDVAASFLKQDLEHDIERWESWYRLAQIAEAKIEDDLIWNSTKLNESRDEIALLERQAIHSYTMAIAIAMRLADDKPETAQKISDLFSEFAMRLYASSRAPLNMEAFRTDNHIRHLSSSVDQSMSKEPFHKPMTPHAVWTLAAHLLRVKLTDKPKPWTSYYLRGKCLWKIFQTKENAQARRPVTAEAVLEAFTDAVDAVPKKERSNEYILEPHFKLVSVVHKMVSRQIISPAQGVEHLQATRFAHKVHMSEDQEDSKWERYILDVLKKLGSADKSNWHHRIIARAAHVIYDDQKGIAGALGAKHEFTQQIFTKTMTLQVWKPEHERPGRHYVYTGRYVSFFVHLLDLLNDRASLDQLIRRIRRKPTDFLDHPKIWEEVSTTYIRLLRRMGKIPEGKERIVFDPISYEDFTKKSEKLENWLLDTDNESIVHDIMRDAIELKKLNNSLMKGSMIDDLIGDSYACLYETFVSRLPPEERLQPAPQTIPQGSFINMTTDIAPTAVAATEGNHDRMRLGNLLSGQGDGAVDTPSATTLGVTISPPVGLGLQTSNQQPFLVGTSPPPSQSAGGLDFARPAGHGKPGRIKTITRREVQRKAEAAIVKPPPIKTPILSKRPVVEIPLPNHSQSSTIGSGGGGIGYATGSALDSRLEHLKEEDGMTDNGENGNDSSRATSRRGSLQDSADGEGDEAGQGGDDDTDGEGDNEGDADDESELSELEDVFYEADGTADGVGDGGANNQKVPVKRSLFPGLMKKRLQEDRDDETDEQGDEGEGVMDDDEVEDDNDHEIRGDGDGGRDRDTEPEIQDSQEITGDGMDVDAPAPASAVATAAAALGRRLSQS